MRRRCFLILTIITVFGIGLAPAATHLQPAARWTKHQLATFPNASDQPVAVGLESLQPLTLAMADFDGDRVPDLLVGYARQNEGVLVLHSGNIDCYRPNSPEALQHRSEGTWSDAPFLSPPRMLEIGSIPEFLLAGDFNGDLKNDVVFGSRSDSKLVLLPGDGQGFFESEESLELPGQITTMASGEVGRQDGHDDLLVGIDAPDGPQLLLFQSMKGAFSADPVVLELPDLAKKITVGQLVGDYLGDFAVAANEFLVIIKGKDDPLDGKFDTSLIDEYSFSAVISDLVAGDFSGDFREELAVLTSDGYLSYLEIAESGIDEKVSVRIHNPSFVSATERPDLLRSRISTGPKDDLIFVNRQAREVRLITPEFQSETSDLRAPLSRTLFSPVDPVAVLQAQLNLDGLSDLVFLNQSSGMLSVTLSSPLGLTYNVNDAGTQYDFKVGNGHCDVDKSTAGDQCSFRAAIQEANSSLAQDLITFSVKEAKTLGATVTQPVIIYGYGNTLTRPDEGNSYLAIQGGDSVITGLNFQGVPLSFSQKGVIEVSDSAVDRGIGIDGISNVTISNNIILGPSYGINIVNNYGDIADMVGIVVDHNIITSCAMAGIRDGERVHNQGSTSLTVTNNTIDGNGDGLRIAGKGTLIQKNFIGTELAGNSKNGILLYGDSAQILNNEIKSNKKGGVWIQGSVENKITDNTFEGNSGVGLGLSGSDSFLTYNLIKDNTFINNIGYGVSHLNSDGLEVVNNSFTGNTVGLHLGGRNTTVKKNWIGITKEGQVLGNKNAGVAVWGGGNEIIDNTIAYNGTPPDPTADPGTDENRGHGSGVEIHSGATSNTISQNRIFDNVGASKDKIGYSQGLGIDVWGNGVTLNDSVENDQAQNYPELTLTGVGEVTISLQSTPNSKFRIELFSNDKCDETGYGEGAEFLKEIELSTNSQGKAQATYSTTELYVTATARITECSSPCPESQLFSTSEFSRCLQTVEPIVVNSTADDPLTAGLECKTEKGECTLRAAIELANRLAHPKEIIFDLVTVGPHVISPSMPLPAIKQTVRIDAAEFTPDSCRPGVAIKGTKGLSHGLRLEGKGSIVSGLAIYGFDYGITLEGEGSHKVECCYVGTDLTGETLKVGNREAGILIRSDSNQIGGRSRLERNVISGNGKGVLAYSGQNKVQGNFIGTDPTGSKKVSNVSGILVDGPIESPESNAKYNLIGGPTPVLGEPPGNVISGNTGQGISLRNVFAGVQGNIIGASRSGEKSLSNDVGVSVLDWAELFIGGEENERRNLISGNQAGIFLDPTPNSEISIAGNLIGTDSTGLSRLGSNADAGILVVQEQCGFDECSQQIEIGGEEKGNVIAFNSTGIAFANPRKEWLSPAVTISQNHIFSNAARGIDGGTPVQPPHLVSAAHHSTQQADPLDVGPVPSNRLVVVGFVEPDSDGYIEVFSNSSCDPSLRGEGERYLGKADIESDGTFAFETHDLEGITNLAGRTITATATIENYGGQRSTSSFSNCVVLGKSNPSGGEVDLKNLKVQIEAGEGVDIQEIASRTVERSKAISEKLGEEAKKLPPNLLVIYNTLRVRLNLEGSSQTMDLAQQNPMQTAVLTLELPESTVVDSYYNYGPTPDNHEPYWYEFLYDGSTGAEILEDQILLHFVDGERGDHDLTVNGEIDTLGTPVLLGKTLYFPYNHVAEGSFVGFAVSNLSDEEAVLKYQAFDEEGSMPDSIHQDEILSLQPGNQLARLGTDIFDHDFGELDQGLLDLIAEIEEIDPADLKPEIDERSWVELTSSESKIGSFFQLGTWDLSKQDGSVAFTEQAKEFYFTRVYEGTTAYRGQPVSTYLSIANPNGETIVLTLTLHSLEGSSINATRSLVGKGFLYESISEIFGEGTEVAGGHVEVMVTEGEGAIGFELIEMENQDTVIGLNASFGNEASEAYSAQLASLSVLYTSVNLINTGTQSRKLTLTGINSDGTNLTSPVSVTLGPGEQYSQDAVEIFGDATQAMGSAPNAQTEFVGSLKVEADGAGVIGDVIFGESLQLDYAAALPLQTQPFTEAVFNQVANVAGFFTGLAVYNPGSVAAAIEFQVVSADGTLVGETTITIEAGQRISPLVPELVSASQGQAGGYVLLKSDKPIIAQLIFGALRSNGTISLFSAVPPTVLE